MSNFSWNTVNPLLREPSSNSLSGAMQMLSSGEGGLRSRIVLTTRKRHWRRAWLGWLLVALTMLTTPDTLTTSATLSALANLSLIQPTNPKNSSPDSDMIAPNSSLYTSKHPKFPFVPQSNILVTLTTTTRHTLIYPPPHCDVTEPNEWRRGVHREPRSWTNSPPFFFSFASSYSRQGKYLPLSLIARTGRKEAKEKKAFMNNTPVL